MTSKLSPKEFDPRELEFFWKISESVVSGRYLKEILDLIVTMTAEMMNSKICSIFLLDEKGQELVIEATQSQSQDYIRKPNIKVSESVSGRAIKEKRPIAVFDISKEKQFRFPHVARTERVVSMLCVPMMIEDRAIGVVSIYTAEPHHFSDEEVKLLRSVANQAAIAIHNTELREEAIAARNAMEVRKLVNRAKAILGQERRLTEDAAHKLLIQISRNSRKSLREVAEAILLAYSTGAQKELKGKANGH